jgi:hypothetical protein
MKIRVVITFITFTHSGMFVAIKYLVDGRIVSLRPVIHTEKLSHVRVRVRVRSTDLKRRTFFNHIFQEECMSDTQRQKIEARAYELFIARGGKHGNDMADWLRAEAEVMGSGASKSTSKGKRK